MDKGEFEGITSLVDVDPTKDFENDSLCAVMSSSGSKDSKSLTKSTLEISGILEEILNKMNNHELLYLRSVSKFWEAEASRILIRRHIWTDWMDKIGYLTKGCPFKIESYDCNNMSDTQFTQLCTLLAKSDNPNLLLKNVKASSDWDRLTGVISCQNILQDFGKFIKCLEIKKIDVDCATLNKFLGQGSYCPNLEVLDLHFLTEPSCDPWEMIQSPLNLKKLALTFTSTEEALSTQEQVAFQLLKNSPQLTHLCLTSESLKVFESYLRLLKTLPQATTNLSRLTILGEFYYLVKELSKIKFSSNLKTVEFLFEESATSDENRSMMTFLKLVSNSVENVTIFEAFDDDEPNPKYPLHLPAMPNLKDLYLKLNLMMIKAQDGADFLKKYPFLTSLWVIGVEGINNGYFHDFLERCCEAGVVHQNLEQIVLGSSLGRLYIQSPATIRLLNQVCPKLSILPLKIRKIPEEFFADDERIWFEQLFLEISKMKNLKSLYVTLDPSHCISPYGINYSLEKLDLAQAFGNLKESPSLEKIRFCRIHFKYNVPEERWLMELIDAPKLRRLTFCSCSSVQMGSESYQKTVELVEVFANRNIVLKIV